MKIEVPDFKWQDTWVTAEICMIAKNSYGNEVYRGSLETLTRPWSPVIGEMCIVTDAGKRFAGIYIGPGTQFEESMFADGKVRVQVDANTYVSGWDSIEPFDAKKLREWWIKK